MPVVPGREHRNAPDMVPDPTLGGVGRGHGRHSGKRPGPTEWRDVAAGPERCGSTSMATSPGREGRPARLRGRQESAGPGQRGRPPQAGRQVQRQGSGNGHALGRVLGGVGEVSGAANEGPRPRLRLPPGDNWRQREASQLRTRSALCLSETALRPAAACRTAPG